MAPECEQSRRQVPLLKLQDLGGTLFLLQRFLEPSLISYLVGSASHDTPWAAVVATVSMMERIGLAHIALPAIPAFLSRYHVLNLCLQLAASMATRTSNVLYLRPRLGPNRQVAAWMTNWTSAVQYLRPASAYHLGSVSTTNLTSAAQHLKSHLGLRWDVMLQVYKERKETNLLNLLRLGPSSKPEAASLSPAFALDLWMRMYCCWDWWSWEEVGEIVLDNPLPIYDVRTVETQVEKWYPADLHQTDVARSLPESLAPLCSFLVSKTLSVDWMYLPCELL